MNQFVFFNKFVKIWQKNMQNIIQKKYFYMKKHLSNNLSFINLQNSHDSWNSTYSSLNSKFNEQII